MQALPPAPTCSRWRSTRIRPLQRHRQPAHPRDDQSLGSAPSRSPKSSATAREISDALEATRRSSPTRSTAARRRSTTPSDRTGELRDAHAQARPGNSTSCSPGPPQLLDNALQWRQQYRHRSWRSVSPASSQTLQAAHQLAVGALDQRAAARVDRRHPLVEQRSAQRHRSSSPKCSARTRQSPAPSATAP